MKKKQQETYIINTPVMDFIMTYGWAILAAIIVIGVLGYFGVFSPMPEFKIYKQECRNETIAGGEFEGEYNITCNKTITIEEITSCYEEPYKTKYPCNYNKCKYTCPDEVRTKYYAPCYIIIEDEFFTETWKRYSDKIEQKCEQVEVDKNNMCWMYYENVGLKIDKCPPESIEDFGKIEISQDWLDKQEKAGNCECQNCHVSANHGRVESTDKGMICWEGSYCSEYKCGEYTVEVK